MADNELEELNQLYAQGVLTDAELDSARQRVIERDGVTETEVAAAGKSEASGAEGYASAEADGTDDESRSGGGRSWLRWWPLAALLVGVVLIVLALVPFHSGKSKDIAVNGVIAVTDDTVTLPDDTTGLQQGAKFGAGGFNIGKGCHAAPGSDVQDLVTGAPVVITDASGAKLASTVLRAGVYDANADCVFGFGTLVKRGESGYKIVVANRKPAAVPAGAIATPQLTVK